MLCNVAVKINLERVDLMFLTSRSSRWRSGGIKSNTQHTMTDANNIKQKINDTYTESLSSRKIKNNGKPAPQIIARLYTSILTFLVWEKCFRLICRLRKASIIRIIMIGTFKPNTNPIQMYILLHLHCTIILMLTVSTSTPEPATWNGRSAMMYGSKLLQQAQKIASTATKKSTPNVRTWFDKSSPGRSLLKCLKSLKIRHILTRTVPKMRDAPIITHHITMLQKTE